MDFAYSLLRNRSKELPTFSYSPIWMLGTCYEPLKETETESNIVEHPDKVFSSFLCDFCSRIWLTYRRDLQCISGSYFTSDAGWGCMLRSGQMVLAQAFFRHFLGRDWRIGSGRADIYNEILSWFADYPFERCPYSLHRIADMGLKYDKNVGEWFGPSTISQVLEELVAIHKPKNFRIYVSVDGCLYLDRIHEICTGNKEAKEEESEWRAVLLLIPLRLGLDKINEEYFPALKEMFHFPQSLGIIGGRPRSSHYFVAYQEDFVFYLDPHVIQAVVDLPPHSQTASILTDNSDGLEQSNDSPTHNEKEKETVNGIEDYSPSYHCPVPLKAHITEMDPSFALAFYCPDRRSFDDFCSRVRNMEKEAGITPIFNIENALPQYLKKKPIPNTNEKFFSDDEDDVVFL